MTTPTPAVPRHRRPAAPRSSMRRRRRVRFGRGDQRDRGSLSLEQAILFPFVLTLTMGAIQVGLWFEARSMCQAAAEAGVRAGKVLNAPYGAGAGAARAYLSDVAGDLVVRPLVSEARTPATVEVQCSGQAQNVIPLPGFTVHVTQSARAGTERFTQ